MSRTLSHLLLERGGLFSNHIGAIRGITLFQTEQLRLDASAYKSLIEIEDLKSDGCLNPVAVKIAERYQYNRKVRNELLKKFESLNQSIFMDSGLWFLLASGGLFVAGKGLSGRQHGGGFRAGNSNIGELIKTAAVGLLALGYLAKHMVGGRDEREILQAELEDLDMEARMIEGVLTDTNYYELIGATAHKTRAVRSAEL